MRPLLPTRRSARTTAPTAARTTARTTAQALAVAAVVGFAAMTGSVAVADTESSTLPPEPVVPTQNDPAARAEGTISKSTVDPATRLAEIKAKGAAEIAKRQATLSSLQARLAQQTKDCGSNAAMATEMTTTSASLTTVGTNLAAATDLGGAKTLAKSIFIDHRVYLLVAPKAGKVIRCDGQLVRNDALSAEATKLQTAIDEAKAKGVDTTAAQAAKDAAVALLITINPAPALGGIMGLVPDKGDKAVQASNTAALNAADAALDASAAQQRSVNQQLDAARKLLRGQQSTTRSSVAAARRAEQQASVAQKQAERANARSSRNRTTPSVAG
jgi:hypothetical protein